MEPRNGRGLRVAIVVALLRVGALGCDDPEAYRARERTTSGLGGAGVPGAAGTSAGAAGTTAGASATSGAAGDSSTGIAGGVGQAGQGGGAGSDPGVAGGTAGAGGGAGTSAGAAGSGLASASGAGGAAGTGGSGGAAGSGVAGQGGGATGGTGGAGGAAGAAGGAAGTAAVDFCDRARWTAKASVTGGDGAGPPGGIDGDLTTRWANNRSQNGTDYYQVDFGGLVKLSQITLNNTQAYPDDYPGGYAVYGSADGATFDATPFVTGAGTTGSTVIAFGQRTVRAVRVNQTGTSRSTNWWQIGELQVVCSP